MEVLIMLSNEAPHIYLHNGVSYSDMELMASVLLNSLAESEKGTVSILFDSEFALRPGLIGK